ncbi:MAG: iron-containing alcohol dehydrogenase [Bacteroidales bacterium]|nr:MAG: iron-containing alcohol dehydrogenase [Bacteroidales bacterium]
MFNSNFFVPTQIRFGAGRVSEIGEIIKLFGTRCLLVSCSKDEPLSPVYNRIIDILTKNKISVSHFDGAVPNPTTKSIDDGLNFAVKNQVDCVLGVGGGSAMDSAKLIALLYTKKSYVDWSKAFTYSNPFEIYKAPTNECLPLITITTTSGTGSHVTQAAVVTDTAKEEKLTIFHRKNFPLISIVDSELMASMPSRATAATGFDAFSHAFESYLGNLISPLTETMSLQAIKLIFEYLPIAIKNPDNIKARTQLAWADTLAGMCLANGGADIPHPLGEIIGGICPRIAHGETLALVYPEYIRFKVSKSIEKFAKVTRTIDENSIKLSDYEAAMALGSELDEFLKKINLWVSMKDYNISEEEYYKIINSPILNHIRCAKKEVLQNIFHESYNRV